MEILFVSLVLDMLPFVAVAFAVLGVYLLRKVSNWKDAVLSHLLFAGALYTFGYFLEVNTSNLSTLFLIRDVYALGMVSIPVLGMRFVATMTGRRLPPLMFGTLSGVSALLWVLFVTNPLHFWFYHDLSMTSALYGRFSVLSTVRGPAYFVLVLLYVLFLVYANIVLIVTLRKEPSAEKRGNLTYLFWTMQTIWLGLLLVMLRLDRVLDPVPLMMVLISALLAFQQIRTDLFEFEVRRWVGMSEGIHFPALLLDSGGSLRAANSSAASLLRQDLRTILPLLDAHADSQEPLALQSTDERERWFLVTRQVLHLRRPYTSYVLTDVTARKSAEEADALELRMALLRAQIRPHFLYNALDAVANVCETDGAKGAELILDLAAYLRKSLEYSTLSQVDSLERELEYVQTYFRIEQARYGDRIHLEIENDCQLDVALPVLVLQPLVENAVRHGISRKPQGGTVRVEVLQETGGIRVRVVDDGPGMDVPWTRDPRTEAAKSQGKARSSVGLSNLDHRLRHIYGQGLEITSRQGQGTTVEFFIPSSPMPIEVTP
jgi:signal transduction histidine kinase